MLSFDAFSRAYCEGENVGVRLGEPSKTDSGYLHLVDLDIRDDSKLADAQSKLSEIWPDHLSFPSVISGSGGSSRHFYFFAPSPFASRKIAHSTGFAMVFDKLKGRDVKKWDWEIELFGTGKQAVLPPSIHPDTGQPYVWERPLDLDLVEMGIGPTVTTDLLKKWGAWADERQGDPDELDLLSVVLDEPLGISPAEAEAILADLPPEDWCDDRDGWLQAGMALHHEFRGSDAALELWNKWSSSSEKFDHKDQARVWKSFGEYRGRPVRMATLKKAAAVTRLEREHDEVAVIDQDDLLGPAPNADDFDDLLGPAPKAEPSINWRSKLDLTDKGGIRNTLFNIQLIMQNDPRFSTIASFSEFSQSIVIRDEPGTLKVRKPSPKGTLQLDLDLWSPKDRLNGDRWSDPHDHAVRGILEAPHRQGGYGIKVSDRDFRGGLMTVAQSNRFHPVREYLTGLEWDGIDRMSHLWSDYLGSPDTVYYRKTAALTLTAAVARIFEPGMKFDYVPILEGAQGARKSSFVQALAVEPSWFGELEGDFRDKKTMIEASLCKWIMELPELQGFTKADVQTIKGYISRQVDTARLAFEKHSVDYKRQFIVIGTTNETEYLRDITGGRRFWPIECLIHKIDIERLVDNRDQIWAEAVVWYHKLREQQPYGPLPLYLDDDEAVAEARALQERRRIEFSFESLGGQIQGWVDTPIFDEFDDLGLSSAIYRDEICAKEVWVDMLKNDASRYDQRAANEVNRALQQLDGWEMSGPRKTDRFGTQRVYRRIHRRNGQGF
jgi:predicted P-loop ATPase